MQTPNSINKIRLGDTAMNQLLRTHIEQSIAIKQAILNSDSQHQAIFAAAVACIDAINAGYKVILAGNGGSAADCQHIAAELIGRFEADRASLAALALTTDSSALTAIANDFGYDFVFSRQLAGIGKSGDVFIGVSTSGTSKNIHAALRQAKSMGIKTLGLTGANNTMTELCDILISVPSTRTPIIQESHIMIGHILCEIIEQAMVNTTTNT